MIAEIIIPKFITKVKIANKQRAKYYKKGDKIPKKYKGYKFVKGYLIDENRKRIVSNASQAGKPKYEILSGNKLLSGYGNHYTRAALVTGLRDFYRPFVQQYINTHGSITTYPLRVEWDCYTVVEENPNWDAGNLFFYYKYFEDSLHKDHIEDPKKYKALIPDDNVKYIIHPPGPKIIPIDNWEDRKFVFRFYHDNRPELQRKPWRTDGQVQTTPGD